MGVEKGGSFLAGIIGGRRWLRGDFYCRDEGEGRSWICLPSGSVRGQCVYFLSIE